MPMALPIRGSENIITSDEFLELEDLKRGLQDTGTPKLGPVNE
jgi:hypothetical protein